jgi:hypothetical protein
MRSILGLALAGLYALAFVVAYWLYAQAPDTFLADLWLSLAAAPYILTVYAIFGSSDFDASIMAQVLAGVAFCCALAYVVGALIEALLRTVYQLIRRRRAA